MLYANRFWRRIRILIRQMLAQCVLLVLNAISVLLAVRMEYARPLVRLASFATMTPQMQAVMNALTACLARSARNVWSVVHATPVPPAKNRRISKNYAAKVDAQRSAPAPARRVPTATSAMGATTTRARAARPATRTPLGMGVILVWSACLARTAPPVPTALRAPFAATPTPTLPTARIRLRLLLRHLFLGMRLCAPLSHGCKRMRCEVLGVRGSLDVDVCHSVRGLVLRQCVNLGIYCGE